MIHAQTELSNVVPPVALASAQNQPVMPELGTPELYDKIIELAAAITQAEGSSKHALAKLMVIKCLSYQTQVFLDKLPHPADVCSHTG